jgi:hypothetical protein
MIKKGHAYVFFIFVCFLPAFYETSLRGTLPDAWAANRLDGFRAVFVSLHLEKCASAASWRPRKDGRLDRRPPFSFDVLERLLDDFVFRLAPHIAAIDENERIFGAGSAVVFASDPDVRVGDPFSQFGDGRLQPDVPAFVANLDDVGQR